MIQISFLGAINTIGASGLLVDTGVEKIVLDYGTKVREVPPLFPIPVQGRVDSILLSHAHLDHSGGIPIFFNKNNNCSVYATDVTKPFVEMLLNDSLKISNEEGIKLPFNSTDVENTIKKFVAVKYRKPFKLRKTVVTAFDAGHIPGSSMFYLDFSKTNGGGGSSVAGGKKIRSMLYTGDFKISGTRLMRGADVKLPQVDVLVTESTYSQREHTDRRTQEAELANTVHNTLANNGISIVSGFALGRISEILLVLDERGIDYPLYIDGMAKKAITIENKYRKYLHDPASLDKALKKVQYISSESMRKRVIKNPGVVLTTSGMLNGGPVVWYIKQLHAREDCSLILTGFQVEDTPGRTLMETGHFMQKGIDLEVKMMVKRLDFSAHIGRSDLYRFIKNINPQKIFCMHGDNTEDFANELRNKGFDATAPVANNRIFNF